MDQNKQKNLNQHGTTNGQSCRLQLFIIYYVQKKFLTKTKKRVTKYIHTVLPFLTFVQSIFEFVLQHLFCEENFKTNGTAISIPIDFLHTHIFGF